MVTLKDIAQLAGVSVMTVSRVVNQQYDKVSQKTVERIQAIIKEQGYVPNYSARSLTASSTNLIAVIVQGKENALEYPHSASMVGYICYYAQKLGYSPLLYFVDDYREVSERLRSWRVDGAIFLGLFDDCIRDIQEDNSIPLVFTDSYSTMRQVTNIGLDDFKGGEIAARHLWENGHTEVGFLGPSLARSGVVRQRYLGFKQEAEARGMRLSEKNTIAVYPYDDILQRVLRAKSRPTAFFVSADIEAMHLMLCIRGEQLRVPEDISIVSFDNMFFGAFTTPALTTVGQDIRRKAQLATDALKRHIEQKDAPSENIVLDVHLIERASVRKIENIRAD